MFEYSFRDSMTDASAFAASVATSTSCLGRSARRTPSSTRRASTGTRSVLMRGSATCGSRAAKPPGIPGTSPHHPSASAVPPLGQRARTASGRGARFPRGDRPRTRSCRASTRRSAAGARSCFGISAREAHLLPLVPTVPHMRLAAVRTRLCIVGARSQGVGHAVQPLARARDALQLVRLGIQAVPDEPVILALVLRVFALEQRVERSPRRVYHVLRGHWAFSSCRYSGGAPATSGAKVVSSSNTVQ